MKRLLVMLIVVAALTLAACGQSQTNAPAAVATLPPGVVTVGPDNNLKSVSVFLIGKATTLRQSAADLKATNDRYYELANNASNDYATLWQAHKADIITLVQQEQGQWTATNQRYQQIKGIVQGVTHLSKYELILDSATPGIAGADNAMPIDVTLPDGQSLVKPGNLLGVSANALWGSDPAFAAPNVTPDFNNNGKQDFGEALPDANKLKGIIDALDNYSAELLRAAQDWSPSAADVFTALVDEVPTVPDYFNAWQKTGATTNSDARERIVSPLDNLQNMVGGLTTLEQGVGPRISASDPAQQAQLSQGLNDLQSFVSNIANKEKSGQKYSAEQADLAAAEANDRATALTGQITQIMDKLSIQKETGDGGGCTGSGASGTPGVGTPTP